MTITGAIKKIDSFTNGTDGDGPNTPLVQGIKDGNLYGTAVHGGYYDDGRYCTIFEVTLPSYGISTV